mmetsp:Transcript_7368/g.16070  ORF Transcript_7368/g.16070 Transcript_7368/m.16070 type:complete len:204 (-) Transcript_7368:1592-2203(-)
MPSEKNRNLGLEPLRFRFLHLLLVGLFFLFSLFFGFLLFSSFFGFLLVSIFFLFVGLFRSLLGGLFFFFFFFLLVIGRDFFVPGCDFSVSHGLIGSFVENLLPFYGSPDGFLERILRPLELLDLLPKGNHISLDYFDVSLVRVNLSGEIINRFLKGCDFNRGRFPSNKDTVSQHLKTVLDTPKLALLPLHHCLQHLLLFFQGF